VRPPWTHTRALTDAAVELLTDAAGRSAIVRAQLEELERADVVVYLVDSMNDSGDGIRATLEFVSCAAGTRYLLVRLDRWWLGPNQRVAMLAHELQHALEIAAAPDVTDTSRMVRLYRRIGWEAAAGRFESDGARSVGNRVGQQLASGIR
ncbi:MAG: hypothetical protein NTY02_15500, partial [Acidobacteria bacterium]|nr:hypothetical protein [Acidobacteriota bacterium]